MRLVLLCLCLLACNAKKEAPRKLTAADVHEPFIDVTPSVLAAMYRSNSIAADREYKGKALRLGGVIDRVGQDATGAPVVVLRDDSSNAAQRLLTIRCAWGADKEKVMQFGAGEHFVARGLGAGTVQGDPLVILCDGERRADDEAAYQKVKANYEAANDPAAWWRLNLDGFIKGKDVENYTVTYLDDAKTQVRIDSDKCDRVRLGVEQLGTMPAGFKVECYALAKGNALQWTLPEAK